MNNTEQPTVKLHSNEARKNLSSSQAFNKMKIKLKRQGINQQLRPIADCSPQFLLGFAEGNTRPLLHLYDTGCVGCVKKTKSGQIMTAHPSGVLSRCTLPKNISLLTISSKSTLPKSI